MSLLTALYSGSSGIDASTDDLSVISNNISNENTIGFKMSRSDFEEQLWAIDPGAPTERLRVVSLSYGYFSMASFLFRPDRQEFVRWLMDQYTETLARYPNARTIDFFFGLLCFAFRPRTHSGSCGHSRRLS